jgi:DNA polymerase-3 subunit epsilon
MKPERPIASDQLGFGFEEPSPAPVSPAKPTAKKISPAASAPPTTFPDTAAEGSAETMARTLEAHPDYRVLRRLRPVQLAMQGEGVIRRVAVTVGADDQQ